MPTDTIYLIGAGGHGKVVLDAMLRIGLTGVQVVDDNPARLGAKVWGAAIAAPPTARQDVFFHVAIGDAAARRRIQQDWQQAGAKALSVIHSAAIVSPCAGIGAGTLIAALAVVGPAAQIGRGVIVNHGAVVDHDCLIGPFSHISPNATLGGGVLVGEGVLVGAGAVILPGLRVGDGAVVGAGAVVLNDVPSGATVMGVPARKAP
jgi:sugar O-acyltransferase (sialic acid O-acetyltransferase NeuD family)